jgi:hypothetical protein
MLNVVISRHLTPNRFFLRQEPVGASPGIEILEKSIGDLIRYST